MVKNGKDEDEASTRESSEERTEYFRREKIHEGFNKKLE